MPYNSKGGGQRLGVGATVVCATAACHIHPGAAINSDAATKAAEKEKADKHAAQAKAAGLKYVTIAMSSMGGWGTPFLREYVLPYYKEMRAKEIAEGGSGWETASKKAALLDRAAVAMCRANANMIRGATLHPTARLGSRRGKSGVGG